MEFHREDLSSNLKAIADDGLKTYWVCPFKQGFMAEAETLGSYDTIGLLYNTETAAKAACEKHYEESQL